MTDRDENRHDKVSAGRTDRIALVTFAVCVVGEVLFILAFDPFVTVDAATHLGSARGFVEFLGGHGVASRLLEWNLVPAPNLLPQLAIAALMPAVGAIWAERLILVGYVILLSCAAAWAVRQTRAGAMPVVFFVLPLTFNLPFLWGFLNFSYSIVGFLLVAGLLARWKGQLEARRTAVLAAVLVLVFFTHLVGYLEAALLTVCILGAVCISSSNRRVSLSRAALALGPGGMLTLLFMASTHSQQASGSFAPWDKLKGLASLRAGIVAYDQFESLLCIATGLALWTLVLVAVVRCRGKCVARPSLSLGFASFVLLSSTVAVFAPEELQSGGTLGSIRYALFPVLGAVLWLACQSVPRLLLFVGATVAGLSALALAAVRYDDLRAIESEVQDLRAIEPCFMPGSTVVQASARRVRFGSAMRRFGQLPAEVGRVAAARGGIDLGNIDWAVPFGLLRFREDTNPYTHLVRPGLGLFGVQTAPPPLDFPGFEVRTGISLDHVILFGRIMPAGSVELEPWPPRSSEVRDADWLSFQDALNDRYVLLKVSPLGLWELWGRRGLSSDCAEQAFAPEGRAPSGSPAPALSGRDTASHAPDRRA